MLELPCSESTVRVAQLEWPQEARCLLEIWADSVDLVNQVLHTDNAVFAEVLFDQLIVSQGDALLIDLAVATLVDELADGFEVRVAVGDVWVDNGEHFLRGFCEADEDTVVDLEETKELKCLAWLGSHLGDTGREVSGDNSKYV